MTPFCKGPLMKEMSGLHYMLPLTVTKHVKKMQVLRIIHPNLFMTKSLDFLGYKKQKEREKPQ